LAGQKVSAFSIDICTYLLSKFLCKGAPSIITLTLSFRLFNSRIVRNTFEKGVREVMPRVILKESIVCYKAILGPVIIVLKKARSKC